MSIVTQVRTLLPRGRVSELTIRPGPRLQRPVRAVPAVPHPARQAAQGHEVHRHGRRLPRPLQEPQHQPCASLFFLSTGRSQATGPAFGACMPIKLSGTVKRRTKRALSVAQRDLDLAESSDIPSDA